LKGAAKRRARGEKAQKGQERVMEEKGTMEEKRVIAK